MKRLLLLLVVFIEADVFAMPYVTNVVARQRLPWNGLVDVSYEIVGNMKTAYSDSDMPQLVVRAIDGVTGKKYTSGTSFYSSENIDEGRHCLIWNFGKVAAIVSSNVVFTVEVKEPMPLYCIVDLSNGASSDNYSISYTNIAPTKGWSQDEFKRSKLVLRRIEPGTCVVSVDKPYYIGIFELSQGQLQYITGADPYFWIWPAFQEYGQVRGSDMGLRSSTEVDADSVMGKLRARTNLKFDLPTEAQWEYACRAGSVNLYSYGEIANGSYMIYAQNSYNSIGWIGTKLPNVWALYDMHGNAAELCLSDVSSGIITRGGWYNSAASECTSASRSVVDLNKSIGLRVVVNLDE